MEITELSINDIVLYRGKAWRVFGILGLAKMVDITPLVVRENNGMLYGPITVLAKGLQPYVLTPEILEKNGWRYDSELNNWWHEGVEFLIWHDEKIGFYCCNITTITLNEVHRLQHLLRLCGLNELADNFKI